MSDTGDIRATRFWTVLRRLALGCLLLTGAAVLRDGVPETCKDAVAEASVVRVCEPITGTDVRVLLFGLAAGLLLFGEVSELGVGGLLTLKRAVAEAKADAADARREVAEIRLAFAISADARAAAEASTQVNVVVNQREVETAHAVQNAERGDIPVSPSDEAPFLAPDPPGAIAAAAFWAGFSGLTTTLPSWADDVGLVGFAVGDAGRLEPHASLDVTASELLDATTLLNEQLGARLLDLKHSRWLAAAGAFDGQRRVGALAVLVRSPNLPAGPNEEPGSDDDFEELMASVEVAAGAYARLVVDILGGAGADR